MSPDRFKPEELQEFQQTANDYARTFVGQECIFREKFIITLGKLTSLGVNETGYRAQVTQVKCEGFFPSHRDPIEVGSAWLRGGQGGSIRNAMILGGAYTAYAIYSDPEVVREARRIVSEMSGADPALGKYVNRVESD